jgi:hypothetical protein
VQALRALTEAHALLATPASSRNTREMQVALSVVLEAMQHKMDCESASHVSQAHILQQ